MVLEISPIAENICKCCLRPYRNMKSKAAQGYILAVMGRWSVNRLSDLHLLILTIESTVRKEFPLGVKRWSAMFTLAPTRMSLHAPLLEQNINSRGGGGAGGGVKLTWFIWELKRVGFSSINGSIFVSCSWSSRGSSNPNYKISP